MLTYNAVAYGCSGAQRFQKALEHTNIHWRMNNTNLYILSEGIGTAICSVPTSEIACASSHSSLITAYSAHIYFGEIYDVLLTSNLSVAYAAGQSSSKFCGRLLETTREKVFHKTHIMHDTIILRSKFGFWNKCVARFGSELWFLDWCAAEDLN